MEEKTCYVSVESRKGGVGKTTAALCLGKLLLQKGWEVLFLDTDITGTNVAGVLASAFWRDTTHIVTVAEAGEKPKQANLLEVFGRGFMAGRGVPNFGRRHRSDKTVLVWEQRQINVIGSEIYSGKGSELICKPSILFDELHAFWFVKCLGEICGRFREAVGKEKRTAIVIDNSPGYVGIGPAVQEWLTDGGLDQNKFLFVSSLDEQDLSACLAGMEALHSVYAGKWKVAKKLAELTRGKKKETKEGMPEWEGQEMRFAVRLLEDGRGDSGGELEFYRERGLQRGRKDIEHVGDIFEEQIGKYQGIVVNRVPRRFKKGWWAYRIDNVKEKNDKMRNLLCDEEHWGEVSTDLMVEYNEYIESQFIGEHVVNKERKWRRNVDELEWIWKSAYKAVESRRERKSKERGEVGEFLVRLNDYQIIIDDLLGRMVSIPMYTLRDLVREEWQPKAIAVDFQRWMWRALRREFPPFEVWTKTENIEHRIHEMEQIHEIVRMEAHDAFRYKEVGKRDRVIWGAICFSGSAALALSMQNLTEIPLKDVTNEFGQAVGAMCAIEAEQWMRGKKKSKDSIAMFLAQERLGKEEYHEKWFKRIPPIPHFLEDNREIEIGRFYESFAKTQARILDLDRDVEFLISMITQVVRGERSERGLLPYIGDVAERVIVHKEISHEQGMEECRKGFRIAESLGQFEGILSKIITKWGIE